MEVWRLTDAFLVLFGEERYRAVVERGPGAEGVRFAGEQLLPLLQPQLLLMQPLLDQEDFRHLRALMYTALDPSVRVCHFVYKKSPRLKLFNTSLHRITLHGKFPRVVDVYLVRSS